MASAFLCFSVRSVTSSLHGLHAPGKQQKGPFTRNGSFESVSVVQMSLRPFVRPAPALLCLPQSKYPVCSRQPPLPCWDCGTGSSVFVFSQQRDAPFPVHLYYSSIWNMRAVTGNVYGRRLVWAAGLFAAYAAEWRFSAALAACHSFALFMF